ncbi:MAG: hypothetical protein Q9227_001563 [Pyrenula ochraceoflavens]
MVLNPHMLDPFNVDELIKLTRGDMKKEESWEAFQWNESSEQASKLLDVPTAKHSPSLQPEFLDFGDLEAELPSLDESEISSTSSVPEKLLQTPDVEPQSDFGDRHVWELISEEVTSSQKRALTSWDTFPDTFPRPSKNPYLSEQPDRVFAAALRRFLGRKAPGNVLRSGILLSSLSQLGLGRSSRLFRIKDTTGAIEAALEDIEESGMSQELLSQIVNDFKRWAQQWWKLKSFLREQLFQRPPRKTLGAFGYAFANTLHGLEARLVELSHSSTTPLQLYEAYRLAEPLLECLCRLVDSAITKSSNNALVLTILQEAELAASGVHWLHEVLREILRTCTSPLLLSIEESVGIGHFRYDCATPSSEHSTVALDSILPHEITDTVANCQDSLSTLEKYEPSHPLLHIPKHSGQHAALDWGFSWEAIKNIQARALEYERKVRGAIQEIRSEMAFSQAEASSVGTLNEASVAKSEESDQCLINLDWDNDGGHAASSPILVPGSLFCLASHIPTTNQDVEEELETFDPPLRTSLAASLQPLLSVQAALVNTACLKMILRDNHLINHLDLCRRYYLMHDDPFRARLSETLFESSRAYSNIYIPNNDVLPPEFSFGIEEENVNLPSGTTEVADLLRLSYHPPPVLTSIISAHSLYLYALIFRHLLRLLRLQHLTLTRLRASTQKRSTHSKDQIPNQNQRLLIATHAFITALSDYTYTIAISRPWTTLTDLLTNAERALDQDRDEDDDNNFSAHHGRRRSAAGTTSLNDLRTAHERTLAEIHEALYLDSGSGSGSASKRVRRRMEKVFDVILSLPDGEVEIDVEQANTRWTEWKDVVGEFVEEVGCEREREREQQQRIDGRGGATVGEELLVRVNFMGFYGGTKRRR